MHKVIARSSGHIGTGVFTTSLNLDGDGQVILRLPPCSCRRSPPLGAGAGVAPRSGRLLQNRSGTRLRIAHTGTCPVTHHPVALPISLLALP
jgi:hypothetical protein